MPTSHIYKAFFRSLDDLITEPEGTSRDQLPILGACSELAGGAFSKIKKNLKASFPLQLLQNIGYIPSVVQYSLVAQLTPSNLYLPLFTPIVSLSLLSTGNH